MHTILSTALYTFSILVGIIILINLVSRKSDIFCEVPGLDLAVSIFTWIPWVITTYLYGWFGLAGCFIGQLITLHSFSLMHSMLNNNKGPTIKSALNTIVGPASNHLGLLISLLALPGFWAIRASQIFIYPLLVWTLKFPRYKESEWINVSRQKFSGLVGHDLIWCLYCDWMTGIYSFGGEMLRNVESFWCPIRFYSDKKCENCKIDFPDIKEWIPADGTMSDVSSLLIDKYPPKSKSPRSWYGHPERKK